MARIYDRVMAEGLLPPLGWVRTPAAVEAWRPLARDLVQSLGRCEVVIADNIAEYFYAGTDQEVWEVTRDFPCVAPPWPTFWIEYRSPSKIVSRETGISAVDPDNLGVGILFQVESVEELWRSEAQLSADERKQQLAIQARQAEEFLQRLPPDRLELVRRRLRESAAGGYADPLLDLRAGERWLCQTVARMGWEERTGKSIADQPLPEMSLAWLVTAWSVLDHRRAGVIGPLLRWQFELDGQGNILTPPLIATCAAAADEESAANLNPSVFPALLTLSFLNCKNVRRVWTEPDAPLSRKYQKKTGKPLCRFWTLEIEPLREVLKREGKSEQTGLQRALHICRGHFAVYDERPLFGKYTGRFWRPSHARGAIKEGVVDKVYAMKKPHGGGRGG